MTALLSDKVVLVSGGTQGVGAGVAWAAAREGAAEGRIAGAPISWGCARCPAGATSSVRTGCWPRCARSA